MKICPACDLCFADETLACPADAASLEAVFSGSPLIDGKYAIERRLGQGGMGVVYRARHIGVDRSFALKLMRGQESTAPGFLARFRVEAAALGRLKHDGIVDVTDFGIDPREGGMPYLVMEYLDGRSLAEWCRERSRVPLEEALPILSTLAGAIDFAHEHGVLHRDLKPGNVLLQVDGASGTRAKVLDFGLARFEGRPRDPRTQPAMLAARAARHDGEETEVQTRSTVPQADGFTSTGEVAGTLAYMAPELLRSGEASRASDLYAFGVLTYEVLVGRRPFVGRGDEIMQAHLEAPPVAPSAISDGLPADLDRPILAALAKDPAQRPRSARVFVAGIRRAAEAAHQREWRAREVPRRLVAAAVIGAVAAAAALALSRTHAGAGLEGRTLDARFALQARRPLHPGLTLVVIDKTSLAADSTPLSGRAEEIARRLDALFAAGVRAVAVDFILPPSWSRSAAFSGAILRHADRIVLASAAEPEGEVIGPEVVAGLTASALGPERASALFALANFVRDDDGVIRRALLRYPTKEGGQQVSFAARMATLLGWSPPTGAPDEFFVDHRVDWQQAPRISWIDLEQRLHDEPHQFHERLVVLGADFAASGDMHRVPTRGGALVEAPGFVVQSVIADTVLAGFPVRRVATRSAIVVSALGAAGIAAAVLCLASLRTALASLAVLAAAALALPLVAFRVGLVLPVLPALGCLLLAVPAAWWLRTRLPTIPTPSEME